MPTVRAGYRSATKSRHLSPLMAWISSHVAYCGSHREHDDHDGVVHKYTIEITVRKRDTEIRYGKA
uniref:Uncharacterized protein n=1 Tax=Oryza glumipatula TaxID=40148 RepID=A0A0D9Y7J2_9ORYZ